MEKNLYKLNGTTLCSLSLYRIFEAEIVQQNPCVQVEDVWAKFEDRFQERFKEYVSATTCTRKYSYSFTVMTTSLIISIYDDHIAFALQHQQQYHQSTCIWPSKAYSSLGSLLCQWLQLLSIRIWKKQVNTELHRLCERNRWK